MNFLIVNCNYISIIVTHYGRADDFGEVKRDGLEKTRGDLMRECITSIKENTDFPVELIVIDNGGNLEDSKWLLQKVEEGVINTYVRNKNNMHFGWARNQGIKLATSEYVCISDNDITYKPNWLSKTIKPLLLHPEKKWLATPYLTHDKAGRRNPRGEVEIEGEKYRLNAMAGSNSMIFTKTQYEDIQPFTTHHITGSHWHRRMSGKGYVMIIPPVDYAVHTAFHQGYHTKLKIKVKEDLLFKGEVDFSYPYYK